MLATLVRLQLALARMLDARDGQEAVEYALALFFLVFVTLVAVRFLGHKVSTALYNVANSV
ncbi:MAG: Flp family type IVb pilin [Solirubrobacteraceae bacterium]